MTVFDQPKSTYSDTTPAIRVIDEAIRLIDPIDTPLIAALGGLNGAASKFNVRGKGTKIELLEDDYHPTSGTTADTYATNTLVLAVTDGSLYVDGLVIKIELEYMVVASISSNNVTVVSRSWGGTNATHASAVTIDFVGMSRKEGDDATYKALQDISAPYNHTSIYEQALEVTGTDEAIDYYGMASPFAYQAKKALPELFRYIELGMFHGIRAAGSGTTDIRSAGGIKTFVTSNSVNAGGMISKADIDELAQACFVDGGKPDVLVVNPEVAKDLHNLYDNSSFLRVGLADGAKLGMEPITHVVTQFATMQLIVDRWCPLGESYALQKSGAGLWTLRPFFWQALAITGDSKKGEVIGEFSFLIQNGAGLGYIYGIT